MYSLHICFFVNFSVTNSVYFSFTLPGDGLHGNFGSLLQCGGCSYSVPLGCRAEILYTCHYTGWFFIDTGMLY